MLIQNILDEKTIQKMYEISKDTKRNPGSKDVKKHIEEDKKG